VCVACFLVQFWKFTSGGEGFSFGRGCRCGFLTDSSFLCFVDSQVNFVCLFVCCACAVCVVRVAAAFRTFSRGDSGELVPCPCLHLLENRRCCGIPYCEADYEDCTRHHRRNLRFVGAPGPCPLLLPSHSCNHYSRPTSRRTCASFTPSSAVPSRSLVQATLRVTAGAWRCVFLPPFSPHLTSLKPAGPSHLAAIAQM